MLLGATFEDKLSVMISWLKYQHLIGGATTAAAWNNDRHAMRKTSERIRYYQQATDSEGTRDIPLPDALKDMRKFKDWDDHLNTYLQTLRGAAKCPLVYVLRDEEQVTNVERTGTVGAGVNDDYRNWDDHAVYCVVMTGTHWESDNMALWQIIGKLARDGPGWDYIRHPEKGGRGNGRSAYNLLSGKLTCSQLLGSRSLLPRQI